MNNRLVYLYLITKHKLFFYISGGKSSLNNGKIKFTLFEYPDYIIIFETKWLIWSTPLQTFEKWRKYKLLKKLKLNN